MSCEYVHRERVVYVLVTRCPPERERLLWGKNAEGGLFRNATVVPYVAGGSGGCFADSQAAAISRRLPFVVYDDNTHGLPSELRVHTFEALFPHGLLAGGYYFWRNDPTFPSSMTLFGRCLYQIYCELNGVEQADGRDIMVQKFDPQVVVGRSSSASLCTNYSVEEGVWSVGCDSEWCFVQKSPKRTYQEPSSRKRKKIHYHRRKR
jgi:hypothetical protein